MGATKGPDAPQPCRRTYEALARKHYREIHAYLRWAVGDGALAADLTQETFVQVWRRLPSLRNRRKARSWIFQIAVNALRQHTRRKQPATVSLDEQPIEAIDPLDEAAELTDRDDLRCSVQKAVARLPDHLREAVALHNLQGLSIAEAAEALGIPAGTVKSRLAKAFSHLRRSLYRWGGEPVD